MSELAWITGASRGIGRSIAIKLAKEGYRLALCCKTSIQELNEVKDECEGFGTICRIYRCDVAKPNMVEETSKRIQEELGKVSLLINNAGISYVGLLSEMKTADWAFIINTNLSSVFYTCKEVIPSMVHKKHGRIINISSVWGTYGASMETAYSASKGGVNALTKSLAKELAPSGIAVNALACGLIDTEMNRHLSEDEISALLEDIPTGQIGTSEEAADMVYMLAKAPLNFTGQIVTLDGGWK
ncbi:MAG: SDR family NAD(P)-dependent oxidoreductase [Lachnoclostridium sp.]|jgi:3-oxoacyl-[acyl-carrier protein] reductase|nr:SDR family NAD(P)-dependent oxidoreductase [Lachnoclostridium sp.]